MAPSITPENIAALPPAIIPVDNEVYLQRLAVEDGDYLAQQVSELDGLRGTGIQAAGLVRPELARRWCRERQQTMTAGGTLNYWMVAEDQKIGHIMMGIEYDTHNVNGSLAYWLTEAARGRGYATRCAGVLLKYAFGRYELDVVTLKIVPTNVASERVAKRLGATLVSRAESAGQYGVWKVLPSGE